METILVDHIIASPVEGSMAGPLNKNCWERVGASEPSSLQEKIDTVSALSAMSFKKEFFIETV
jgi:hypothetical protein